MIHKIHLNRYCLPITLLFPLILTFFLYSPGLTGGFLFDDYASLNTLAAYNPTGSSTGLMLYLSNTRPLAFLSFLLNDTSWPSSNASGFILTNILFHLICGLLLIWLTLKICQLLDIESKEAECIAILTGTFWLIHPLLVSTTVYIVQRMTIIATLFIFASLLSYTHGRLLIQSKKKQGYYWLTIGVLLCAGLGLASKEIAALVPCYLFLFETILFKKPINNVFFIYWKKFFVYLPVIFTVAFFFYLPYTEHWISYEVRAFSPLERLLTESRVLVYYLYLLLIPKSLTFGLHYENIVISTDLFSPITTFFSSSLIIAILFTAIFYRKKQPILSFSVLFFFAGHLLESTITSLEIYFEHRNYLPSSFLFFALSYSLVQLYKKHKKRSITLITLLLVIYSSLTYSRASLWGNPLLLMSTWTEINPKSARNYMEAIGLAKAFNRPDLVTHFSNKGLKELPNDPYINISHLGLNCNNRVTTTQDLDNISTILKTTEELKRQYVYKNLTILIKLLKEEKCSELKHDDIKNLLHSALMNPNIKHSIRRQELHHALGNLALLSNKYQEAFSQFKTSFLELPNSGIAQMQIAILASSEQYDLALQHKHFTLNILEINYLLSENQIYNFKDLEKRLLAEMQKQ